ncbi:MAG: HAD-IIIC family phosphatase [Lachnospiraceae bacterium]|nr:HAD-IIIC family phosphatase [Lachnospiraceae bacterium]
MEKWKCIVFDLDNTIWDGILSEGNITPRHNMIEAVRKLDERGILVSVSSKNEEVVVMEELRKLRIDQFFVFPQINHQKKYKGILKISQNTGISTSQMVFVDDDFYEIKEMNAFLPDVKAVTPDQFELFFHNEILTCTSITGESKNRRQYFLSEMARFEDEKSWYVSGNEACFEKELKMSFLYRKCLSDDKGRVEELLSRTNKFNNHGQIAHYKTLIAVEYKDKYFAHGIIGVFACRCNEDVLTIDMICVSCRMYARGLVGYLVQGLMDYYYTKHKIRVISLDMRNTANNQYLPLMLKSIGFKASADGMFRCEDKTVTVPEYIDLEYRM